MSESKVEMFENLTPDLKSQVLSYCLLKCFINNIQVKCDLFKIREKKKSKEDRSEFNFHFIEKVIDEVSKKMEFYDRRKEDSTFEELVKSLGYYPVMELGKILLIDSKYSKGGNDKNYKIMLDVGRNSIINDIIKRDCEYVSEKLILSILASDTYALFFDLDFECTLDIVKNEVQVLNDFEKIDDKFFKDELEILHCMYSPKDLLISLKTDHNIKVDELKHQVIENLGVVADLVNKVINNNHLDIFKKDIWITTFMKEMMGYVTVKNHKKMFELMDDINSNLYDFMKFEGEENGSLIFKPEIEKFILQHLSTSYNSYKDKFCDKLKMNNVQAKLNISLEDIGTKMYQFLKEDINFSMDVFEKSITILNKNGNMVIECFVSEEDGSYPRLRVLNIPKDYASNVKKAIEQSFKIVVIDFWKNYEQVSHSELLKENLMNGLLTALEQKVFPEFDNILMTMDKERQNSQREFKQFRLRKF